MRRGEGVLAADGPLVVPDRRSTPAGRRTTSSSSASRRASSTCTGAPSTGRSTRRQFDALHRDMMRLRPGQGAVRPGLPGPAPIPSYRLPIRIVTEFAWHNLFARNMFICPRTTRRSAPRTRRSSPSSTSPSFKADPAQSRHALRRRSSSLNFGQQAGADRRHQLRRRDQEVDLHRPELPAAAAGRAVDALLGEHRRRRATRRCSSACRAPARPRCRAIPSAG